MVCSALKAKIGAVVDSEIRADPFTRRNAVFVIRLAKGWTSWSRSGFRQAGTIFALP